MFSRIETGAREFPAYFEMVVKIETNWQRYFGYAFLLACFAAYSLSCMFLPQVEEMISEARRQRYVRT